VRITQIGRLQECAQRFADARPALQAWTAVVQGAAWRSIRDVRQTYAHADAAKVASGKTVTIFNIKGNHYRLIVAIDYALQVVNILQFMPHAEYSKDRWKESL
jgi:mRNA interferase HigB